MSIAATSKTKTNYSSNILFEYNSEHYRDLLLDNNQIKDEFLHGWCAYLQLAICRQFPEAEPYEIFEKSKDTEGEYWNVHQIVKFRGVYIDVRGIFTEEEMIKEHYKEHYKINRMYGDKFEIDSYLSLCEVDNIKDNSLLDNSLPYELAKRLLIQIRPVIEKLSLYR
jgi:hypothetical protein